MTTSGTNKLYKDLPYLHTLVKLDSKNSKNNFFLISLFVYDDFSFVDDESLKPQIYANRCSNACMILSEW